MPFCSNCGSKYEEGSKFCIGCGKSLGGGAEAKDTGGNGAAGGSGFGEFFGKINDTPDSSAEFDKKDIEENKAMAILAYIWLLVLVPFFAAKGSKYARFHTNQGFILLLCGVACAIAESITGTVFGVLRLGLVAFMINTSLSLAIVGFMVLGIVNAASGKAKELPFIGKFRLYK